MIAFYQDQDQDQYLLPVTLSPSLFSERGNERRKVDVCYLSNHVAKSIHEATFIRRHPLPPRKVSHS
jgi:hypothetical protein